MATLRAVRDYFTEQATRNDPSSLAKSVANVDESRGPWRLYFSQAIWPSTLALSMLHMTVLSFGQLMIAYVRTLGVSVALITAFRGLGEVFGLAATRVSPRLVRRMGAAPAATLFIWAQWTMLAAAVVGALPWARTWPPLIPVVLLMGGVGASRLGLWGFDLSVSQMMQEQVSPPALPVVSGVQHSLEALFSALASVAAIFLSTPSQFSLLAIGSFASITIAGVLHTTSQR